MNIQHGQKRPHTSLALPIAIIAAAILSVGCLGVFLGLKIQDSTPEDEPVQHSFGHIELPKAPHEREPLPLPVGVPVPRPVGTPVVTQ